MIVSSITEVLTFLCCGFTRTKFMVLCFLVWIAHVKSCKPVVAPPQVIQWSFPQRRDKTTKVTSESLLLDALFVLTGILITYHKFISKKQMVDTILSLRPLSSFAQTLFAMTIFDYYPYGIWNHIDMSQLNSIL